MTRHIQRLHDHMKRDGIEHQLIGKNILSWLIPLFSNDVYHIHFSSAFAQYILALSGRLFNKPTIMTVHRDIGRYEGAHKWLNHMAVKTVSKPLLLNQSSYELASKLNPNAEKISAFIPPLHFAELSSSIAIKLQSLKNNYNKICCTNAFNYVLDQDGREIYQISPLVDMWQDVPAHALIISDPTGCNYQNVIDKGIPISKNVLFITEVHDFIPVLQLSDVLIRCTTTDGDSISVKEALFYHKYVLASDCVERPSNCRLFDVNNLSSLKDLLNQIDQLPKYISNPANAYTRLKEIYYEYGVK